MNKFTKKEMELMLCYIKQYGFDMDIGLIRGLDLITVLRLKEIEKEDEK